MASSKFAKFFTPRRILLFLYPAFYFLMFFWFIFVVAAFTHMCDDVTGSINMAILLLSWNVIGVTLLFTLPVVLGIGLLYKKVFKNLKSAIIASVLILIPMLWILIVQKTLPAVFAWNELDKVMNYTNPQNKQFIGQTTVCGFPDSFDSWEMTFNVLSPEDFEEFIIKNPPAGYRPASYNKNEEKEIFLKFMSDEYEIYVTNSRNKPNVRISPNVYHN